MGEYVARCQDCEFTSSVAWAEVEVEKHCKEYPDHIVTTTFPMVGVWKEYKSND